MLVRRARAEDAAGVVVLLEELGYARSVEAVEARLVRDAASADDPAWVAVDPGASERPVGFVAGHLSRPYELDDPAVEITALVVSSTCRAGGVGRALVTELEAWADERHACRIGVSSSFRREGAHAFYASLGYGQRSKKFEKVLRAWTTAPGRRSGA